MALTTEPGLRQPNALYDNITVEDFMETIDRVDPELNPLYSMAEREMDLGNTEFAWNVDLLPTPNGALGVADNENVASGTVRDVTTNIRKMGNIGQGFRRSYGAGWIAKAVPNIAGLGKGNIIKRGRGDAYILLKQDIDVAFCSTDQTAYLDTGPSTGSLMSGLRQMIDKANQYSSASGFGYGQPTDVQYAATGAFITGTSMSSTFNLASIRGVIKALRNATARKQDYYFVCGVDLREQITFLTDPQTVTATATGGALSAAATQVRMFKQEISDSELGISIDVVRTDFGRCMVVETKHIGTTTTNSTGGAVASSGNRSTRVFLEQAKCAYIFPKGQLFKRWGVPFYEMPLPDSGGGPTFDVKGLCALGVRNPMQFGAYIFTG